MTQICSAPGCEAILKPNPRRKGTMCQPCSARHRVRSPEELERCRAAVMRYYSDPLSRQRHAQAVSDGWKRALAAKPELREAMANRGRRARSFQSGVLSSETRQKMSRSAHSRQLDWCPIEYRPLYRELVSRSGNSAAEARRMVEDQIAVDLKRFQRSGELQVGGKS